jgi:hypothetical protein
MATISRGRTFINGEILTPNKLNELVDLAGITPGTVITADLANDSVTAAKLANDSVTSAKIASPLDLSGKSITLPAVQPLARPLLTGYRETTVAATGTSGTITIDLNSGSIFTLQPTGNITGWTINNRPPSGVLGSFVLRIAGNGTAYTWTWPTTTRWAYGEAPIPTTTSGKFDLYSFFTFDGGTTWFAQIIGQNY